ncbi:MAG: M1 family metallopeptidase [Bacteroidota bacterium]
MKKIMYLFFALTLSLAGFSQSADTQSDTSWKTIYRASPEKTFNLVHTKLDVKFDLQKSYLYGKAWVTVQPHFYDQNILLLDAKGMDIKELALINNTNKSKLKFEYDNNVIRIPLDKPCKRGQKLTVFIDYTAKPNDWKTTGSSAITDAKGLYFINPTGKEKNKPTQIWTQGETEAASVWFPTIDKPNQKTTQEINMTVPVKWVTLSNGKLIKQQTNTDGTRTDSWKMDQPHAPYLFFMGAGEFSVIKDNWKGKEVSYYVENEYAPVARKIFGNTPEMMTYFSRITGVDYPWVKYAQMVGRDFVSGAMENTTATLHQESAQQDARSLTEGNIWESTIAHELFHHWFGDYVTTESWSNLTLNESFANYSEYLWDEYKYGKDKADDGNYKEMQGYLQSNSEKKDLVRFYYKDKEDMFDGVSYNKGGRILHMLRNYIGDSAFFKSINLYLTTYKYKTAEAHQLRQVFEEITGKDLNWFFNQWYYGSGHPNLDIQYSYDTLNKKAKVIVKQLQKEQLFNMPVAIDVYLGEKKTRHQVWIKNQVDSFSFEAATQPDLINFDGDKILLCTKKENKNIEQYIHQYKYAPLFLDRKESIDYVMKKQDHKLAPEFIKSALQDRYDGLKKLVLQKIDLKRKKVLELTEPVLVEIAKKERDRITKSLAIDKLGQLKKNDYAVLFLQYTQDSSYALSGAALNALNQIEPSLALEEAKKQINQPIKGSLLENVASILIENGETSSFSVILSTYESMPLSQTKLNLTATIADFLGMIHQSDLFFKGVDAIINFRDEIPAQYGITSVINNMLKPMIGKKESAKKQGGNIASLDAQIEYLKKKIE